MSDLTGPLYDRTLRATTRLRTRATELAASIYADPVDGRLVLTAPAGSVWKENERHTLDGVAIGAPAWAMMVEQFTERIRTPKPLAPCEADRREDCESCLEASDPTKGATP